MESAFSAQFEGKGRLNNENNTRSSSKMSMLKFFSRNKAMHFKKYSRRDKMTWKAVK